MMNKLDIQKVHEITFVGGNLNPFTVKLANVFRTKGYKINSISRCKLRNEFEHSFDDDYYFFDSNLRFRREDDLNLREICEILAILIKKFKFFFKLCMILSKIKRSVIIGQSEPNDLVALIFLLLGRKGVGKIYFPYDISYFRYKNYNRYPWLERFCEKYNFRHCSGIIHKGPKDELKYLPKEFKALAKPSLQFLPYCDKDAMIGMDEEFFERKLSKKDGGTHLVYAGGVNHNRDGFFSYIDTFKEIVKQGLFLHIYPHGCYEKLVNDPDYKILQNNRFFHLHKPVYGKEFRKEISKYDWGVHISFHNFEKIKRVWAQTASSNKISSYVESGLPVITNSNLSFVSEIVKTNGFGIVVKNPTEINDTIKDTDYKKLLDGLSRNREDFTLKRNINRFTGFIDMLTDNGDIQ